MAFVCKLCEQTSKANAFTARCFCPINKYIMYTIFCFARSSFVIIRSTARPTCCSSFDAFASLSTKTTTIHALFVNNSSLSFRFPNFERPKHTLCLLPRSFECTFSYWICAYRPLFAFFFFFSLSLVFCRFHRKLASFRSSTLIRPNHLSPSWRPFPSATDG